MIFVNQVNHPLILTKTKINEHSPSSGMSMAAVVWKAQIQVITPSAATNPRLLCDFMFSRWILDVLKKRVLSLLRPQFISLVRWRCGTCESSTDGEGPMNPPTRWHTERQTPKHNKSPMTGSPTALCSARHNQAHRTFFICINRDSVLFQFKFCCDKEIFTLKLPINPFPWDSNCFVVRCRWESVAESIFLCDNRNK